MLPCFLLPSFPPGLVGWAGGRRLRECASLGPCLSASSLGRGTDDDDWLPRRRRTGRAETTISTRARTRYRRRGRGAPRGGRYAGHGPVPRAQPDGLVPLPASSPVSRTYTHFPQSFFPYVGPARAQGPRRTDMAGENKTKQGDRPFPNKATEGYGHACDGMAFLVGVAAVAAPRQASMLRRRRHWSRRRLASLVSDMGPAAAQRLARQDFCSRLARLVCASRGRPLCASSSSCPLVPPAAAAFFSCAPNEASAPASDWPSSLSTCGARADEAEHRQRSSGATSTSVPSSAAMQGPWWRVRCCMASVQCRRGHSAISVDSVAPPPPDSTCLLVVPRLAALGLSAPAERGSPVGRWRRTDGACGKSSKLDQGRESELWRLGMR
ncbi:hypothetical protein CDD83_1691 [Cordyceps sp. RAO-2017]|nr:hypothetical protein CDD83_1691 [Cordyceps sp. RAO-2017]